MYYIRDCCDCSQFDPDLVEQCIMIIREPYYVDTTTVVPEPDFYILFPAKGIMSYKQIISSRLYVHLKETCSLASQALYTG